MFVMMMRETSLCVVPQRCSKKEEKTDGWSRSEISETLLAGGYRLAH